MTRLYGLQFPNSRAVFERVSRKQEAKAFRFLIMSPLAIESLQIQEIQKSFFDFFLQGFGELAEVFAK